MHQSYDKGHQSHMVQSIKIEARKLPYKECNNAILYQILTTS